MSRASGEKSPVSLALAWSSKGMDEEAVSEGKQKCQSHT